jgi:hypothetical protein
MAVRVVNTDLGDIAVEGKYSKPDRPVCRRCDAPMIDSGSQPWHAPT